MRIFSITPFSNPMNSFLQCLKVQSANPIHWHPRTHLFQLLAQRPIQQLLTIIMLNKPARQNKQTQAVCLLFILSLSMTILNPINTANATNTANAASPNDQQQTTDTISAQEQPPKPLIYHKQYRYINPKTGYRTSYYKAGLPKSVPGGTRITLEQAHKYYLNQSALFLDVMAHTGTGPDPIDGKWRLSELRENIKGSIWLADVGTGTLSDEMSKYLKSNLTHFTKNDKSRTLIIYCTADCWMAWNAVQRISRLGYKNLLWFPEGSDDWKDAGYPLENATPIPLTINE